MIFCFTILLFSLQSVLYNCCFQGQIGQLGSPLTKMMSLGRSIKDERKHYQDRETVK